MTQRKTLTDFVFSNQHARRAASTLAHQLAFAINASGRKVTRHTVAEMHHILGRVVRAAVKLATRTNGKED